MRKSSQHYQQNLSCSKHQDDESVVVPSTTQVEILRATRTKIRIDESEAPRAEYVLSSTEMNCFFMSPSPVKFRTSIDTNLLRFSSMPIAIPRERESSTLECTVESLSEKGDNSNTSNR